MTVTTTNAIAGAFDGNGVTTVFPFTDIKVLSNDDFKVYFTDTLGTVTSLTENIDYSLDLNVDQDAAPGGSITFPFDVENDKLQVGEKLTGKRIVPETQLMDLANQSKYDAEVVELSADKQVMLLQQLAEELDRTIKLSISDSDTTDTEFPAYVPSKVLQWDDANAKLINSDLAYTNLNTSVKSYDNVAAIRAIAISPLITHATMKGYYDDGDGGGGFIYWDESSTEADNGATIFKATAITVGRWKRNLSGALSVKQAGAKGDGVTDDTTAFINMISILVNGSSVLISKGTYILSSGINFTQDDLTIVMERGAVIKQADNTQTLDTLVTVSGDRVIWDKGTIDANLASNISYTGRGESMRWSGDYADATSIKFEGSHGGTSGVAAGLHTRGRHGVFDKIHVLNAENACVRDHGDFNSFPNQRYDEFDNKGFLKDSGVGGAASTYTYVHILSAVTLAATALEAVLFDHDGVQGGACEVQFGYISAPNMTGPDLIKFAYMKDVTIRGFRGAHATVDASRITLRLQQKIERVYIDDCVFPASINFDADTEADIYIGGGSVICDTIEAPVAIADFAGTLTVEDGVSLKNLRNYAVSMVTGFPDSKLYMGRVKYHGAATYTPSVLNPVPYNGTARRIPAGSINVRDPLSISGTMRTRAIDGSWITGSDIRDATCSQVGGDRLFLVGGSDFPPREAEAFQESDIIRRRTSNPSDSPAEYWCTTAGAASTTAWVGSTAYSLNNWRFNGTNVYVCTTAGTSAASGGPTGTGTGIVDGTSVWDYVDALAVFKGVSSIAV